jgi:hypothetical protein
VAQWFGSPFERLEALDKSPNCAMWRAAAACEYGVNTRRARPTSEADPGDDIGRHFS